MTIRAQPTRPFAAVPGPARDTFRFYAVEATGHMAEVNALWEACRHCASNLVWVNDHYIVTPNPLYLQESQDFDDRYRRVVDVLLCWFTDRELERDRLTTAQRLVDELPVTTAALIPWRELGPVPAPLSDQEPT